MDVNNLLIFVVLFSCLSVLWRLFRASRSFRERRAWAIEAVAVLILLLVSYVMKPGIAGLIAGGPWIVLFLIPSLAMGQVSRLSAAQNYSAARRFSAVTALLHPFDGFREQPDLIRSLEYAQKGDHVRAEAILNRYGDSDASLALSARIALYRLNGQWADLLAWFSTLDLEAEARRDPTVIAYYMRALGEDGKLEEMLNTLVTFDGTLRRSKIHSMAQLFILAFAGRRETLETLFRAGDAPYSSGIQGYWLATADLAAGRTEQGRNALEALLKSEDVAQQRAVQRRLDHPLPSLNGELSDGSQAILDRIVEEVGHQEKYGERTSNRIQRAPATYALIALNLLYFGVEASSGGSENPETLYRLGAMLPTACMRGEWWRLPASCFLHFGPIHLMMNMIGLYYLGPFVEKSLGWVRYVAAYLAVGIGSGAFVVWLTAMGWQPDRYYVGASGAIMGVIGMTGTILFRGWRIERAAVARRRLMWVAGIIALQVIFDQTNPQVSGITHLAGVGLGWVIGMFL